MAVNEAEKKRKLLKRFGTHLRKVRQEKGLSGAELGRLCFLEKQNIYRIEKGETNVTLHTLSKICEALGMDFSELFDGFK